jgi:hypothetical protein
MIPDTPVKEPVADHVADLIMEKFTYGSHITFEWLEVELREKRDTAKFAFGMITVTSRLKENGYRLSRQGTKGTGYRILEKVEMQPHTARQEKQKVNGTKKNFEMLAAVDTTDMKEPDRVRHEHWRDKLGYLYMHASAILRRKKLPPQTSPVNPFQIK